MPYERKTQDCPDCGIRYSKSCKYCYHCSLLKNGWLPPSNYYERKLKVCEVCGKRRRPDVPECQKCPITPTAKKIEDSSPHINNILKAITDVPPSPCQG